jgi:hypothetical protein
LTKNFFGSIILLRNYLPPSFNTYLKNRVMAYGLQRLHFTNRGLGRH